MCNREHAASEIVAAQKCSVFEFFYVYWRVGSLLDLGGELVGLPSVASAGGGAGGILGGKVLEAFEPVGVAHVFCFQMGLPVVQASLGGCRFCGV